MANFLRLLLGLVLLPMCWGLVRVLVDALEASAGASGWLSAESVSFLGGMLSFALAWMALPHPVKTYVFGHELTHALWGLIFGAVPSDLHVSASGGSVRISKSNVLITLAPYFFPFYTFVVILVALLTAIFIRPLPYLPLWLFLVGFTWAFHVLFTLETLAQRQPDIKTYGRIFSWTFIFLANLTLVLVWLATMTPLTFSQLGGFLSNRISDAYVGVVRFSIDAVHWIVNLCSQT